MFNKISILCNCSIFRVHYSLYTALYIYSWLVWYTACCHCNCENQIYTYDLCTPLIPTLYNAWEFFSAPLPCLNTFLRYCYKAKSHINVMSILSYQLHNILSHSSRMLLTLVEVRQCCVSSGLVDADYNDE